MGISYSAVKTTVPEAWEIGKDYYGLTDLFPACAMEREKWFGIFPAHVPPLSDLPHLVGSRHWVSNTVFRITDYYATADEMVQKAIDLKQRPLWDEENMRGLFAWAGDDPIQLISEFDDLEERDAADEYQLCGKPTDYVYVNPYNGEAGRKVGFDEDDYCTCATGAQGAPVDADCPRHGLPEDEEE